MGGRSLPMGWRSLPLSGTVQPVPWLAVALSFSCSSRSPLLPVQPREQGRQRWHRRSSHPTPRRCPRRWRPAQQPSPLIRMAGLVVT
eukprot:scaffold31618_cov63-Phaeocystis_antarctica.AAC.4